MQRCNISLFAIILLILSLLLSGCLALGENLTENYNDKLIVHFIDVGQGDSTFIEFPNGKTSLIDAGTRRKGEKVEEYLNNLEIERIDYLIATHPHEDHIGGLPNIIKNFSIGKVYMPDKISNTLIFEELLKTIKEKDLNISLSKAGDQLINEENLKFIIIAPNKDDYLNTNNFSIVSKIEYGNNSFLITGDAEKASEFDMIEANYDLKSDVLRVGHHGGNTSTNKEFLEEVDPEYSIISLGEKNAYGHPHEETIIRLKEMGTNIMRTDELGNIVIVSNGKTLDISKDFSYETKNKTVDNKTKESKNYYIGNKNTKVFHSQDCGLLPMEKNQVIFNSIEEAKDNGYKKHKACVK